MGSIDRRSVAVRRPMGAPGSSPSVGLRSRAPCSTWRGCGAGVVPRAAHGAPVPPQAPAVVGHLLPRSCFAPPT